MIVRMWGGLGNQLFCYAFGLSVALARQRELQFEKFDIDGRAARPYGLGAYNVGVKWLDGIPRTSLPMFKEKVFCYDPDVYTTAAEYFVGHWQTEKYFNMEVLRRELTLRELPSEKTQRVAEEILKGPSCAVHVRRGDYTFPTSAAYHGCMDAAYYLNGMQKIREANPDVRFFIFSDDHAWCRQAFNGIDFTSVDHNGVGSGTRGPAGEHEDLFLISLCQHAVIPNSTFGWWGAEFGDWLHVSKNRTVIAPAKWFLNQEHDTRDICPQRWVRL